MVGDRLLPPDGGTKLEFLRRDGLVLFGWIFLLLPRYGENNKLYFPLLFPLSPPPPLILFSPYLSHSFSLMS
jgi:hypothetical protein